MNTATLLLNLAAPMQSWSSSVRSNIYQCSQPYPTKSGVLGLIANAQGRDYTDDITDLSSLAFGVRLDRPGVIEKDFVSMRNLARADGGRKAGHLIHRTLIRDARFLVGLCSDRQLLEKIQEALLSPARLLYLGRKACIPTLPFVLGIVDADLEQTLRNTPWMNADNPRRSRFLLALIDDEAGPIVVRDVPLGCFADRTFRTRRARWISIPITEQEDMHENLSLSTAV